MTIKAALYARYSTDNQSEASIEDQFRTCERTAASNGLTVVCRFEDRGISGGTADRPGYQSLLTTARAGAFEVIVTEDISRLWRSRSEYGPRSAELEDLGIDIVTTVGDDTRRDGYGLILGIKQAIAENYRREISYRTKRGLEGKALAGQSTGGKCYGYDRCGTIDEAQALTVRRIFTLAADGFSAARIAETLSRSEVIPPRAKPYGNFSHFRDASQGIAGPSWQRSTVDAILRNVRYTGAVIWGRTESKTSAANSRHKARKARKDGPVVERFDAMRQIIDRELFDRVQQKRACKSKK
jgi:site-specific DNA recombinase